MALAVCVRLTPTQEQCPEVLSITRRPFDIHFNIHGATVYLKPMEFSTLSDLNKNNCDFEMLQMLHAEKCFTVHVAFM